MLSSRYFLILLLIFISAGCSLERNVSLDVTSAPPYWQPQSQLAKTQLEEMSVFHDNEATKMSEDILVFRNSELERLAATGKEMKNEDIQRESPKTPERDTKWTTWFKKRASND